MTRFLPLVLLSAGFALGGSIQTPQAGAVRFANESVYPVLGVSRAFVLGQPIATHASTVAFADRAGIVADDAGLTIVDCNGTVAAHWDGVSQGAALSIQDAPLLALAWLPASSSLVVYTDGNWRITTLATSLPGPVLAVRRASKDTIHLLISEGQQVFEVTVGIVSGNVLLQRLLPDAKAPATYLFDGILSQDGDSLVFQSAVSGKKSIRFSGTATGMEQMSDEAVHINDGGARTQWMLEFSRQNGLELSQLPVPAMTVAGGSR